MKMIVANSNLSMMPTGHLFGSAEFNAIPVYFVEKQSRGDSCRIFDVEIKGAKVGVGVMNDTLPLDEKKAAVDKRVQIGTFAVTLSYPALCERGTAIEDTFEVYLRTARTSGKVVRYLRNKKGDAVETLDAF